MGAGGQQRFGEGPVILLCPVEVVEVVEVSIEAVAKQQEYSVIAWKRQEVLSQTHLVI